jgi:hypothetical protein
MEKARHSNFVVRLDDETMKMLENLAIATQRTKAQTVRASIGVAYALFVRRASPKDLSSQNHNPVIGFSDPITRE